MTTREIIIANIKAAMKDNGWTISALSRTTGIDRPSLSNFLNNKHNTTIDYVETIAAGLGLTLLDLLIEHGDIKHTPRTKPDAVDLESAMDFITKTLRESDRTNFLFDKALKRIEVLEEYVGRLLDITGLQDSNRQD